MANTAAQTYVGATGVTGATGPGIISNSSTIASASTIAITPRYTHFITGNTPIVTMTGGTTGDIVTLVMADQTTYYLLLTHGTSANNLSMRDLRSFGIYKDESVTFQYDGAKWIEINRDVKTVLDSIEIKANVSITGTSENSATTVITNSFRQYDGATPIEIEFYTPNLQVSSTTMYVILKSADVLGGPKTSLGIMAGDSIPTSNIPFRCLYSFTPAAGQLQYSINVYATGGSGLITAASGTSGTYVPAYSVIRRAN
jgi:hypothetical protein